MISYIVCIGCFIHRKNTSEPLPGTKFSLGRFSLPVAGLAICYLALVFIIAFFPAVPLPILDASSMNWSSLIFSVAVAWSMLYYVFWSRHIYQGPVKFVQKEEDLPTVHVVQPGTAK